VAQESPASDLVRGDGRSLRGSFEADGEAQPGAASRYVFTDAGAFGRAWADGAERESGTYAIDGDGRLVLYVERRGDALFTAAEREIARLEVRDDGLTIGREGGAAQRYKPVDSAAGDAVAPPE
jgi:hypothetical protein